MTTYPFFLGNHSQNFSSLSKFKKVLIVEDSITVRKLFADCLSTRYFCVEASSVGEALERLEANEFDLVITDVLMPGLSVTELLGEINERYPRTNVLIVTGADIPPPVLTFVDWERYSYLRKPCRMSEFEKEVEKVLGRRQLLVSV